MTNSGRTDRESVGPSCRAYRTPTLRGTTTGPGYCSSWTDTRLLREAGDARVPIEAPQSSAPLFRYAGARGALPADGRRPPRSGTGRPCAGSAPLGLEALHRAGAPVRKGAPTCPGARTATIMPLPGRKAGWGCAQRRLNLECRRRTGSYRSFGGCAAPGFSGSGRDVADGKHARGAGG